MTFARVAAVTSFILLLPGLGCGGAEVSPVFGSGVASLEVGNGKTLNGKTLNGKTLNGTALNALQIYSSLTGVSLADGLPLDIARVQATVFSGTRGGTTMYQDSQFVGARFLTALSDGSFVIARIDGMAALTGSNSDLFEYWVSWYDPGNAVWQPLCTDASGDAVTAIPLPNRWNYQQGASDGGRMIQDTSAFTFACKNAALAKCVLYGYRPWVGSGEESLAAYHQACTRMLRADYCGDGTPYTQDGTPVDVYDDLGIQVDDAAWTFEAEWDENGARCVNGQNRARGVALGCYRSACGAGPFSNGGIVASEINPTW